MYLQLVAAPPPPSIGQSHRGGGGFGQKSQQQQYRQSGRFLSVSFNEDNAAVSEPVLQGGPYGRGQPFVDFKLGAEF